MAYVLLPNSGQSLGVTRDQIKENFSIIQTVFAVNHYAFDATGQGKHKVIQMPEQTVFPATPADEGQLLTREYNTKTELAWRPENTLAGGDQYILSGMPIRAAARFDGSGANGNCPTIGLSFNITSITKSGAGSSRTYSVVFASQFPIGSVSANYLVLAFIATNGVSGQDFRPAINNIVAGGFDLITTEASSASFISFIVLGG